MTRLNVPDQVQFAHLRQKWNEGTLTLGEYIQFYRNSSNPLPSVDQSLTILPMPFFGIPVEALPWNDERLSWLIGTLWNMSSIGGPSARIFDYSYGFPGNNQHGAIAGPWGVRVADSSKSLIRETEGPTSVDEIWITLPGPVGTPLPSPSVFVIVEGQLAMRQPSWERFNP